MQKNEILTVEILSHGAAGEGVAKPEGFPLFIPGAIEGEVCRVQVVKLLRSHGFARLLEVLEVSPHRTAPPCPAFSRCGGCQLMHMDRNAQLARKREIVENAFRHIGGLSPVVHATAGDARALRYRNKIQMPVATCEDGIAAGFFAPRSPRLIPCADCLLQSEKTGEIIRAVIKWMEEYGISPYNEETHKGLLRHIYVREGSEGECMVSLVTKTRNLPFAEELSAILQPLGVSTLLQNINPDRTNVILGKGTRTLFGTGTVTCALGGIAFSISHHSFFQVNAPMAEKLYEKGISLLGDISDKTVFDLYSGIGSISLFLAKHAKKVIGVEIVPEAVRDAKENAEKNGFTNAFFYAGDAFEVTKRLIQGGERADIAVVDPPRKGCDAHLLETLLAMSPEKILYISCNPATLARDAKFLSENGYTCEEVFPFDLFPQTAHVECCVLLCRE